MIGAFLTRAITMLVGYIYPAYECFKTVEQRRPNLEVLRFWCQYWIIISLLTVVEKFGDALISWVPMYGEAKLAFIVYLWYPRTRGTTFIYYSFLRPYLTDHESEIDQHLSELRTRALDFLVQYWQKGQSFLHEKFIEILQYIASHSGRQNRAQQGPPPPPAPPQQPPPPPQGPPPSAPVPAGFRPPPSSYNSTPSNGFDGPSALIPSAPPYRPPVLLQQQQQQQQQQQANPDLNYRPGFYPPITGYQPPLQQPNQQQQHRATLGEEIDLDEIDDQEGYVMPSLNVPVASSTSSSRYMTRSRHRSAANRG